jgi:PD-(D/E)XK endonuclease
MNELAMDIKHPKLRGEWAELRFMAAAAEHGLHVTKPWGETAQYDFAVESEGRFVRVQVKSTGFKDRGGYSCSVRGSRGAYVGNAFDFLAAYIVPEDVWFVIPRDVVNGRRSVALYPHLKKSKYGQYKNAWELLKEAGEPQFSENRGEVGHARGSIANSGSVVLVRALRCAMCSNWEKCYAGCERESGTA